MVIEISNDEFKKLVSTAIDNIPEKYFKHIKNLAFVVEDEPTPEQRQKLKLNCHQSLYGLYEGIPLTKRGAGYNLVLPDKITIFKRPIQFTSTNLSELTEIVNETVWHEVAHYFGLDHKQIHQLNPRH